MTGTGARTERRYAGGPLDGQAARGHSLVKDAGGMALSAAHGDRAMSRLRSRRPLRLRDEVYIRRGDTYQWLPDRTAAVHPGRVA